MKSRHLPKLRKYENRFYLLGIMTGFIVSSMFHAGLYLYDSSVLSVEKISTYNLSLSTQIDTNKKLLGYVEGKWVSSVNDMYISININKTKDIIILELVNEKTEKLFKIVNIVKVDGMLGYIALDICEISNNCEKNELISIQINKIFGLQDTITMTYDSRMAICMEQEDICIRAFKRV